MYSVSALELKAAAQKLPPSPQIFGKLGKLLRDRNTGIKDITSLVNTDTALTAQVLRISNSPSYNIGEPIDNLDEAINRVGFKELFRVVGMAASKNSFSGRNTVYNIEGATLWENSLATGLSMEFLARIAGEDEAEAYTLGLLKSIGKQVIDACLSRYRVPPRYYDKYGELQAWETQTFEMTNAAAASYVLKAWNFPEEAYQTIEYQYEPDLAPPPGRLCRLLNISNAVAEKIGKPLPGESSYWDLSEECLEEVEMTEVNLDDACEYVTERMAQVVGSVAAK